MSSFLMQRRPAAWSDEEDEYQVALRPPLERVEGRKAGPVKRAVEEAYNEGVLDDAIDEIVGLMGSLYPFNPDVRYHESGRVYIWLPEFAIHAEGADFDEAAADLVDEALFYVGDWEEGLASAPNHAERSGWVRRIQLNRSPHSVYRVLFGE
jgi:hypothetical protein